MAPAEILLPEGEPIGTPSQGGDERIRTVTGGQERAREIYRQLAEGGTPYHGDYPGRAVTVPNGGFVGIRGEDTETPTIDVNIPTVSEVRKLHFR
jgi:hypothetical protein